MNKFIKVIGLMLILAGCSIQEGQGIITLENLGPAPELENEVWINTDKPLHLAELGGQVVLVDMWTYG
jgi:hypothetical protein